MELKNTKEILTHFRFGYIDNGLNIWNKEIEEKLDKALQEIESFEKNFSCDGCTHKDIPEFAEESDECLTCLRNKTVLEPFKDRWSK